MSEIVREKQLNIANAGSARTELKLVGVSVNVTCTYQRIIALNPGTEFEEKLVADSPQIVEHQHFDTNSDEDFVKLLNLKTTVKELVEKNDAEAIKRHGIKGASAQEKTESSTKTGK